jgi:O-antigen/teichoic acid export membrane protein
MVFPKLKLNSNFIDRVRLGLPKNTEISTAERMKWLASSALLSTLVGFVTVLVAAKYLGPSRYAIYGAITSALATVSQVIGLGLPGLSLRDAATLQFDEHATVGPRDAYFAQTISLSCIIALGASVAVFLYFIQVVEPKYQGQVNVMGAAGAMLVVLGNATTNALVPYYILGSNGRLNSAMNSLRSVGLLVVAMTLAPYPGISIVLLGAGIVTMLTAGTLAWSAVGRLYEGYTRSKAPYTVCSIVSRSLPSWIGEGAVLISMTYTISYSLLINQQREIYSAFVLGNHVRLVYGSLSASILNSTLPELVAAVTEGDRAKITSRLSSHDHIQLGLAAVAVAGTIVFGPLILSAVGISTQYASTSLFVTTFSIIPFAAASGTNAIMIATNRADLAGLLNVVWAITLVGVFSVLAQTTFSDLALPISLMGAYSVHWLLHIVARSRIMAKLWVVESNAV